MIIKQSTLLKIGSLSGIGLHSGKKVTLRFLPLDSNVGIIFRRIDLISTVDIPAVFPNVVNTKFSTVLEKNGVLIKTVEHLLAAIFFLSIDNILIEIDADEVPIMDGTSYPFVYVLRSCGFKKLDALKIFIKIRYEVVLNFYSKLFLCIPDNSLSLYISLNSQDFVVFKFFKLIDNLLSVIKSRTYGFYNQHKSLLNVGLVKGAAFNNVLVFYNGLVLNKNILRYRDEVYRHKVLDCLGDFALFGVNCLCSFSVIMPNHMVNNKLLNYLLLQFGSYELVVYHNKDGFVLF